MNKYIKFLIIALVLAVAVPQVALAAWWNPMSWGMWNKIFHFQKNQNQNVACTMDAKLCPDGSSVGREGPKCEFKACPKTNCVAEGKIFGANDVNLHCCEGLIFKPTTQSGTVGECVKDVSQTAGWKTYTNSQYGFEFQYPKEWVVDTVTTATRVNVNVWESEKKLQDSKNAVIPIYPEFSVSYQQMDSFKNSAKELLGKDINGVKDFVSANFSRFATTKMAGKTAYAGITVANRAVYSVYIENNNRVYVLSTGNLDESYQDPNNPKLEKNIQQIFSSFKISTNSNATAGWKTYTNSQYGFEFKYPATFSDYNPLPNFPPNPAILVQLKNNVGSYLAVNSLDETGYYAKENLQNIIGLKTQYKSYEKIKIGSLDAYRFYIEQLGGGKNIETFIYDYPQKGKMLRILFEMPDSSFDSEVKVFENISKTFKFTTPTNSNAGWKTYTNSQYGFEIKYPNDAISSENNEDLRYWGGEQAITAKNPIKITKSGNSTTPVVNVFIGTDPKIVENCLKFNYYQPNQEMAQMQKINGVNFYTASQGDAAMGGQRGTITQYSVVKNNICYSIQAQISWRDVTFVHGATDGKQPTQAELEAQSKAIQAGADYVLKIVNTFKFTK